MVGRIYKGITKHCYTQNIKALGLMVSEKILFMFSYCKSMGDICCHGNENSDPILPKAKCILSPSPVML